MFLEDISYLELWWLPYTAEQNNLFKFGRGIMRNISAKLF